jgi:nitrogen fixation NifU-like protein
MRKQVMDELRELYQEVILDHNKNPRNFRIMDQATHVSEGRNPLCGDHYTIYLKIDGGVLRDISFYGSGCAISKASASIMTSELIGKKIEDAQELFTLFHKIVTGEIKVMHDLDRLGKIAAFSGVAEFPVRVKCATLAWHALHAALKDKNQSVSTEGESVDDK